MAGVDLLQQYVVGYCPLAEVGLLVWYWKGSRFQPLSLRIVMKSGKTNVTANRLKTGIQPAAETSYVSSIPQAVSDAQHSISVTFFRLLFLLFQV